MIMFEPDAEADAEALAAAGRGGPRARPTIEPMTDAVRDQVEGRAPGAPGRRRRRRARRRKHTRPRRLAVGTDLLPFLRGDRRDRGGFGDRHLPALAALPVAAPRRPAPARVDAREPRVPGRRTSRSPSAGSTRPSAIWRKRMPSAASPCRARWSSRRCTRATAVKEPTQGPRPPASLRRACGSPASAPRWPR